MNSQQILDALEKIDLKGEIVNTGNPDYVRCFVYQITPGNDVPLSLGRITIYKGKYSHIKWYIGDYGDMCEYDYPRIRWSVLLVRGVVITRKQYDEAMAKALSAAEAKTAIRKQWRLDNPKSGGRHSLSRPNPRGHIMNFIEEAIDENRP